MVSVLAKTLYLAHPNKLKINKYSQQLRQLRHSGSLFKSNNICTFLEGITKLWRKISPNSLKFTTEIHNPGFFPGLSVEDFQHCDPVALHQTSQVGFSRDRVWASQYFKSPWVILVQSQLEKSDPLLPYGTALTIFSLII